MLIIQIDLPNNYTGSVSVLIERFGPIFCLMDRRIIMLILNASVERTINLISRRVQNCILTIALIRALQYTD